MRIKLAGFNTDVGLMGLESADMTPETISAAYARISRRACQRYRATWIDTRGAAFRWLHHHRAPGDQDSRLLTEDGEHLNATGVALVAEEVVAVLAAQLEPSYAS